MLVYVKCDLSYQCYYTEVRKFYVCMYVCTYVRMYVCTYVCMYVCMYVRTYVCTYVRTYVCMYAFKGTYAATFLLVIQN